jgi:SH3-like domain-containing protein
MQSRTILSITIILTSLVSVGFAQEAATSPEKSVIMSSDSNEADVPSFPYVAEITGDNVNIRSGPGTQYYSCGRLNKGDRVKVVNHQFGGWSCIVPPTGSFSWISTQYVSIDPDNPTIGTVTGNGVRVWVGSDRLRPIYSTTSKLKLNKGEKVKLMGEEMDKYYKIAPPTGAYRWVSTKYTKALGPVREFPLPVVVSPPPDSNAIVPTRIPVEAKMLEEYYALEKQTQAERAKPLEQQNYTKIKKALLKIAANKEAGKATRYSEFAIKQIKRFELAREVAKAVRLQDEQLQRDQEQLKTAGAKRLAEIQDLGRFAAIGQFQTFETYGHGHYRIIDDSGKTVCYTLPTGPASKMNLSKLVGRKVGLVGTIKPHPQTAGALVRFTEIVELK